MHKCKEIFPPEKCPQCGQTTAVEHYDNGWRVVCEVPNHFYGEFHWDKDAKKGEAHSSTG